MAKNLRASFPVMRPSLSEPPRKNDKRHQETTEETTEWQGTRDQDVDPCRRRRTIAGRSSAAPSSKKPSKTPSDSWRGGFQRWVSNEGKEGNFRGRRSPSFASAFQAEGGKIEAFEWSRWDQTTKAAGPDATALEPGAAACQRLQASARERRTRITVRSIRRCGGCFNKCVSILIALLQVIAT
ncbi:hypothetical protein GW17_00015791 [Ensete ventricosum]|nr:hypothetical protein GW17_00015791 [Ensete ventricosum]RZR88505.1 hypothetical protein BHM03_00016101 [Ensete ventricosum]